MKKKFIIVVILIISIFMANENADAWLTPINNKTSLAVGVQYDDGINSIPNANYANSTYSSMGFTYKKLMTTPTYDDIQKSHSNGTPLLQSGIIFLNGHVNHDGFNFVNVLLLRADVHTPADHIIGITYYDNTKTGLYVMAGCKTAEGTENITKKVFNSGAKISIGWSTDLSVASFVSWNERFHDKISDKTTSVIDAVSYANSFFY